MYFLFKLTNMFIIYETYIKKKIGVKKSDVIVKCLHVGAFLIFKNLRNS